MYPGNQCPDCDTPFRAGSNQCPGCGLVIPFDDTKKRQAPAPRPAPDPNRYTPGKRIEALTPEQEEQRKQLVARVYEACDRPFGIVTPATVLLSDQERSSPRAEPPELTHEQRMERVARAQEQLNRFEIYKARPWTCPHGLGELEQCTPCGRTKPRCAHGRAKCEECGLR